MKAVFSASRDIEFTRFPFECPQPEGLQATDWTNYLFRMEPLFPLVFYLGILRSPRALHYGKPNPPSPTPHAEDRLPLKCYRSPADPECA